MTQSTAVEPVLEAGRLALKNTGSLAAAAEAMVEPVVTPTTTDLVPFPPLPEPLVITEKVGKALRRLKDVFNSVTLDTRRRLTDEECTAVHAEYEVLKEIGTLLEDRREALKEYVRTSMDVDAEERGIAVPKAVTSKKGEVIVPATPRDANGHYVLAAKGNPDRCAIPGTNQAWSREFRSGQTTIDTEALFEMYEAGDISREAFLAMTKERRVFDEAKATAAALDKPDLRDEILRAVAAMRRPGTPGTSLFVRKA